MAQHFKYNPPRLLSTTVCGIPAQLAVHSVTHQPPLGPRADSDVDCYGWTDVEYTVCDRRGRPAPWLERKLTERDHNELRAFVEEEVMS